MHNDKEETYIWALQQFHSLFSSHSQPPPTWFSTDCELALMNALEVIFSDSYHCLCVWHIKKSFVSMLKKSLLSHTNQGEVNTFEIN